MEQLKLCICNNDLYHHNLYHFCYNRMERSQNLMYQICVTGLNMIGIQRHNFTVNVAAFSPENRGKKGCFSLTFFVHCRGHSEQDESQEVMTHKTEILQSNRRKCLCFDIKYLCYICEILHQVHLF